MFDGENNPDNAFGSATAGPSEDFSNVMSQLLMGMEELRRSTERSRPGSSSSSSSSSLLELDDLRQFLVDLQVMLPAMDQLARWTADRADPHSVEADLFRHVQVKLVTTAHQILQVMMHQFTEPSPLEEFSEHDTTSGNGGDGGAMMIMVEDVLREYQGIVAQTVELNLRLLLNNPPEEVFIGAGEQRQQQQQQQQQLPTTADEIVKSYVGFQRQTLRTRVKPAIAQLVQERKRGFSSSTTTTTSTTQLHQQPEHHHLLATNSVKIYADENDDDDDDSSLTNDHPKSSYEKHHANALAIILGQAAALINPLLAWQVNLPPPNNLHQQQQEHQQQHALTGVDCVPLTLSRMCAESIQVLNEQAQQLAKTVSEWFWVDRPVDLYMEQSAAAAASDDHEQERTSNIVSSFLGSGKNKNNNTASAMAPPDLGTLDGLVEEMALSCLLLAQYHSLIGNEDDNGGHGDEPEPDHSTVSNNKNDAATAANVTTMVVSRELLPEWSWKYAALERYLAVQQWHKALTVAQPVQIVMGTLIYVPSVVEDAQYLSTRALERASSTQALSAMGTVAHAIAHDVWSTEIHGGVYQALVLDERGCWLEPDEAEQQEQQQKAESKKKAVAQCNTNTFASALLDALDEDLGGPQQQQQQQQLSSGHNTPPRKSTPRGKNGSSTPSSGNFLSALTLSGNSSTGGSGGGAKVNMRLLQMHAKFCALNGIHAASCACRSLVEYLDGLLPTTTSESAAEDAGPQHNSEGEEEEEGYITAPLSAEDAKATAMIQLAREELFRFASMYEGTLKQKVSQIVAEYAKVLPDDDSNSDGTGGVLISGGHDGLCLDHIGSFIAHESYNIDAKALQQLERDDRLEAELMGPLQSYIFLQQIAPRLEHHVMVVMAENVISRVVQVILVALWRLQKRFTDWGSLLLSKQVRLIQGYIEQCVTPTEADGEGRLLFAASSGLVGKWERLTQVVAILQMEQPAEWLLYHHYSNNNNKNSHSNNTSHSVLTPDEVAQTMALRVDFKPEAIAAVSNQISKNTSNDNNENQ